MVDASGTNAGSALGFRAWGQDTAYGLDSWDCFGTTVTEAQVRAQAEVMARE